MALAEPAIIHTCASPRDRKSFFISAIGRMESTCVFIPATQLRNITYDDIYVCLHYIMKTLLSYPLRRTGRSIISLYFADVPFKYFSLLIIFLFNECIIFLWLIGFYSFHKYVTELKNYCSWISNKQTLISFNCVFTMGKSRLRVIAHHCSNTSRRGLCQ